MKAVNQKPKVRHSAERSIASPEGAIYNKLIELCLFFLIIFTPFAYGAVQPWSIAVFEVTAALMAFIWLLKMLKNGKFEFIRTPINGFIFLFIFYIFLQFFFSLYMTYDIRYTIPSSIYSWSTKTDLLKIISYSIIFLVTLNTIKTRQQITRILSVIVVMGFIMSIFYLMRYFGANAPRGIINSDHFSGYLGMIIPLALGLLFIPFLTAKRFLLFFAVITMSAALFFTMSRGGMFSFIAALLFMGALVLTRKSIKKKGWILSAVIILIVLTILWLGATPVVERILSVKAEVTSLYFGGRLPVWQGTFNIIKDYPIFGTGLGTFNYIFPKYQPAQIMAKHYTYAHSDFLELLSETGIVGFLLTVVCGLWTIVYLFRRFNMRHNPWVVAISIGFFGSLATIFVHSFADFNLHIPSNAILLTIILSLFLSALNYKSSPVIARRPQADEAISSVNTIFIPRFVKFALYPVVIFLAVIFIIVSAKPALADYYFRNTRHCEESRQSRDDEAISLSKAIRLDPTNAEYHYQFGKTTQFIDEYSKAVALNPTNSQYHQSLAWAYGQIENASKAHQEFKTAIELSPTYYYPYQVYAIWLFNHPTKDNIEKGVEVYRKAVILNPALVKEALDRYRAYQTDYAQLLNILPGTKKSDAIFLRYLLTEESIDYAIQFAERFLKSYKENAECYFWIADKASYDKAYKWDFVRTYYLKALELEPDNVFYRHWYTINLARFVAKNTNEDFR